MHDNLGDSMPTLDFNANLGNSKPLGRVPREPLGRLEFVYVSLKIQGKLYIPRVPGPRVPQTILVTILWELVAWIT